MKVILLGAYTPAALKGLMSGSDRKAAVESALAAVGGTLERLAFTRGEYDVVVRATVPDSSSLIGLVVAIKATGAFEKADYLEEIDISPVLDVANKIAYTPPAWRKPAETILNSDWMNWLVQRGYAAVFFDSAAARGVSANAMMGPGLMPNERAADVFVVLEALRNKPFVDKSKFALVGMSHGGDTALDALVQSSPGNQLIGLTNMPSKGLEGLRAIAAFYPGCRAPVMGVRVTEVYDKSWSQNIPVAIFQGGNDTYVDIPLCQAVVERQKASGTPIEYHFYDGEPHCFDANYGDDADCYMSDAPAKDARNKVEALLDRAFK